MDITYFTEDIEYYKEFFLGVFLIYLVIIIYTRLYGLKSFGKMTSFDFAHTVVIGSLMASTASTGKPSIFAGLIILGMLFLINFLITLGRYKSERLHQLIDNTPVLLMKDGEICYENLRRVRVSEDALREKLRAANVVSMTQVKAVVLETTGDFSVLHADSNIPLDEYLLDGVRA